MSPRLQSNPQVAQSNPQVDTQVAQSMLKVPQDHNPTTDIVYRSPMFYIMLRVAGGNCAPKVSLLNASAITATAEGN